MRSEDSPEDDWLLVVKSSKENGKREVTNIKEDQDLDQETLLLLSAIFV
jgi:hypothetical protein